MQNVLGDRAVRRDRDKVSLAASHELAEMLVDPGNNLWADAGKGLLYAYEVCDAVKSTFFPVNGLAMTDFLFTRLISTKSINPSQRNWII